MSATSSYLISRAPTVDELATLRVTAHVERNARRAGPGDVPPNLERFAPWFYVAENGRAFIPSRMELFGDATGIFWLDDYARLTPAGPTFPEWSCVTFGSLRPGQSVFVVSDVNAGFRLAQLCGRPVIATLGTEFVDEVARVILERIPAADLCLCWGADVNERDYFQSLAESFGCRAVDLIAATRRLERIQPAASGDG
ncbi:hypothetical protein D9M68_320990 [compost metagenome]